MIRGVLDEQFDIFNAQVIPEIDKAYNIFEKYRFEAASFSAPNFDYTVDILGLLKGVIDGGVGVLPSTSMITFCNTNASSIYD